jgi:hypothetical protein
LLTKTTGADGVWGPLKTDSATSLEFVVAAAGRSDHPHLPFTTPAFARRTRPSTFDRSSGPDAGAENLMTVPRGYFGLPRDVVLLDGKQPSDIPPGLLWKTTLKMPTPKSRPVVAEFNQKRTVVRPGQKRTITSPSPSSHLGRSARGDYFPGHSFCSRSRAWAKPVSE